MMRVEQQQQRIRTESEGEFVDNATVQENKGNFEERDNANVLDGTGSTRSGEGLNDLRDKCIDQ
jgi:hypothetical protein